MKNWLARLFTSKLDEPPRQRLNDIGGDRQLREVRERLSCVREKLVELERLERTREKFVAPDQEPTKTHP